MEKRGMVFVVAAGMLLFVAASYMVFDLMVLGSVSGTLARIEAASEKTFAVTWKDGGRTHRLTFPRPEGVPGFTAGQPIFVYYDMGGYFFFFRGERHHALIIKRQVPVLAPSPSGQIKKSITRESSQRTPKCFY